MYHNHPRKRAPASVFTCHCVLGRSEIHHPRSVESIQTLEITSPGADGAHFAGCLRCLREMHLSNRGLQHKGLVALHICVICSSKSGFQGLKSFLGDRVASTQRPPGPSELFQKDAHAVVKLMRRGRRVYPAPLTSQGTFSCCHDSGARAALHRDTRQQRQH